MCVAAAVAGAGLAGSFMQADAASSAADQQAQATQSQIGQQNYEFNTIQGLLKPYVNAGTAAMPGYNNAQTGYTNALGNYGAILGQLHGITGASGPAAQQAAITGLQQNPLYTTSMNLGQQAILANASATGGLRGGNTIANLGYLPGQVLSNVMQTQIGNLNTSLNGQAGYLSGAGNLVNQFANMIGLGENAAAGTGNAALQTGNNITGLIGQQGAIGAGATIAGGNAFNSGLNSISGALGQYLNNSGGGGGGYNFSMPAGSSTAPAYLSAAGLSPSGMFGTGSGMGLGG